MKNFFKITMLAMAAVMLTMCGKDKPGEPDPEPEIKVSGVSLNKTTLTLTVGASETLTATVAPAEAKNKAVTWKSSDESVASVTTNGAVTAKKAGNATITVTTAENNRTATCAVTVSDAPTPEAKIKLADPSHATQTAWADELHTGAGFTFTARAEWTAEVKAATGTRASDVEWVRLLSGGTDGTEKYDGAAGTHTLTVGLDHNYTGAERKATVTLTAGGEKVEVNITHAATKSDGSAHTPPTAHIAVTDITDVPTNATAGTPLTLSGTVVPDDATNRDIVWTVASAGTTGATITGNTLNTTSGGTATVTATIAKGASETTDYTKDFSIAVEATPPPPPEFVAVTGITGVPTAATAGTPLTLSGTVTPGDATNRAITWTVKSAGTTGATISGTTFNATAAGTATVTATIAKGTSETTDYTQTFSIAVAAASSPLTFTHNSSYDLPTMTVGMAIMSIIVADGVSGGTKPYTFSATDLPAGFSITLTGYISGIPTTPASATTATITVTDSSSPQQSKSITIQVGSVVTMPPTISINSTQSAGMKAGVAFTVPIPPGSLSVHYFASNLPAGNYPNSEITVSGLPSGVYFNGGSASFNSVRVDYGGMGNFWFAGDGTQQAVTDKVITVTIGGATGTFKMTIFPAFSIKTHPQDVTVEVGSTFNMSVEAQGGTTPYTYQWYSKNTTYPTWRAIREDMGGKNRVFTSTAIDRSFDGFQFYCVVTDDDGTSVTSSAATLTVK